MWQPDDFKTLFQQLRRHGLPLQYSRSIIEELTSHQQLAIDADRELHLGTLHDLCARYVRQYRQGSWLGRFPGIILFVSGLFISFTFWIFFGLLGVEIYSALETMWYDNHHTTMAMSFGAHLAAFVSEWLPLIAAGYVMRWLALRTGRGPWAYAIALFWPTLLLLGSQVNVELPTLMDEGDLTMEIGFGTQLMMNYPYAILMMACLCWSHVRVRHQEQKFIQHLSAQT